MGGSIISSLRVQHLPGRRAVSFFGIVVTFILILLVVFLETGLDESVQALFYNPVSNKWWMDKSDTIARLLFYDGPKILLVLCGIAALILFVLPYAFPNLEVFSRQTLIMFIGCLIIIPLIVGGLKQVTNIYCPSQLQAYGGGVTANDSGGVQGVGKRGKCFPAGHASGGFALLSLYFVFRKKRDQFIGFTIGTITGWSMGLYQIVKGDHFVSHTLVSMLIAWLVAGFLDMIVRSRSSRSG